MYMLDVCLGSEYPVPIFPRNFKSLEWEPYQVRYRSMQTAENFWTTIKYFENSFFPCYIKESEQRHSNHRISLIYRVLDFKKPSQNSIYVDHGISGIKLLACLRLYFSHKFCHNFKDTVHPICGSSIETEA